MRRLLISLAFFSILTATTTPVLADAWQYDGTELSRSDDGAGDAKLVWFCADTHWLAYVKLPAQVAPFPGPDRLFQGSYQLLGVSQQPITEQAPLDFESFSLDAFTGWSLRADGLSVFELLTQGEFADKARFIVFSAPQAFPARPRLVFALEGLKRFGTALHNDCRG